MLRIEHEIREIIYTVYIQVFIIKWDGDAKMKV